MPQTMTETPKTNPCKALNCDCADYTRAPSKSGIWEVCGVLGCSHTAQSHSVKPGGTASVVSTPEPVTVAAKPSVAPVAAKPSESLSSTSNAYSATPAQMRQWLRDNGFTPGARGRIHPDHRAAFEKAHASK